MLIKLISDTHNEHSMLTDLECDILVHSGDACIKGNYSEGYAFLMWYVKQPSKYKILVPGNHDHKLRTHPDLIKLAYDLGIHVLNNDFLEINGIKFYGVSKTFMSIDRYDATHLEVRKKTWSNIPKDLDMLITHMPPHSILDTNREGIHCGCPELTKKVAEVKPRYHVFGHLHEQGHKSVTIDQTQYINVANKNREYIMVRPSYKLKL